MCRILAFNTREELNPKVLDALIKSAKLDPYSIYLSHPDGWGFSIYVKKGGAHWRNFYYRSPEPIYEDFSGVELLKSIKGEKIVGVIHVRRSGKKFLLGVTHNHPYHKRINQYDVFLAHNGSINRNAFSFVNPYAPYTDSYLFLEELSYLVKDSTSIEAAYRELFHKLKDKSTSLNSALLFYSEAEGPKVLVGYYYNKSNMREINEEYYRMYSWGDYVFSSTLKYYLNNYDNELDYDSIRSLD